MSVFSSWRDEPGNAPKHPGRCGHCEGLLGPWVGSEMGREEEEKGIPGSSAQETTWPVHVDLLIFSVCYPG